MVRDAKLYPVLQVERYDAVLDCHCGESSSYNVYTFNRVVLETLICFTCGCKAHSNSGNRVSISYEVPVPKDVDNGSRT